MTAFVGAVILGLGFAAFILGIMNTVAFEGTKTKDGRIGIAMTITGVVMLTVFPMLSWVLFGV